MKRNLIYMDAKSSKFWNIDQAGNSFTVTFGRIGTDGQSLTKSFPDEATAVKEAAVLIKEKLGKGYVDTAASGAATGIAVTTVDDHIPFIAFSSINHREDISENIGTFVGRRVIDYDPEKPIKPDGVYRFRSDWENNEVIPNLEKYLESDEALETTALVFGAWHGDDPDQTSNIIVEALVNGKDRLPKLAALYIGDITSEENEMSWIKQSDLSPLLPAFPKLELLRARGGDGLALASAEHGHLRALALETGGMDVSVIRSVCTAKLPNLEYLELWLGTEEYGANYTVADLQPVLSGQLFPKLKYLGLRNCQRADELAGVIVNSPLLQRIETLDLSLGMLTDEGARALLLMPLNTTLKKLNLHYNYISEGLIRQLKALPLVVDASKPSNMDTDDEWRFVAVGE
ncbi:MAG TPA: STM4015 family protein [Candidatus Sulfotelmatobacter sp.]|nr:STM4015 family protein [Candidatus Sulfotelmatobacter sp.]